LKLKTYRNYKVVVEDEDMLGDIDEPVASEVAVPAISL
jgi:hypothetical protein